MQIWSLGQEDALEEDMATHSSILAWKIQWTKDPEGYSPRGPKEWVTPEHTGQEEMAEKLIVFSHVIYL